MSINLRFLTFTIIAFLFILLFGLFSPFSRGHLFEVVILWLLLNVEGIALRLKSKEKLPKQLLISTNIYFLFFLIVGILFNTVESDLAKGQSLYAMKLMNAGLIGLGISYLFFKADKLKLGSFFEFSHWFFIVTLIVLGTSTFDILRGLGYPNLALIAGIIGWIIGPVVIITLRKVRRIKS